MRRSVAPLLLLLARPARGQVVRSWLEWRTVETPHFAFHYPIELEAWTRDLASHMESIDSAVVDVVGYRPERRIQVVVDDPYKISNGAALPFLNSPVITIWATPPTPEDEIGEYRSWGVMVASHEFAHQAHLLRPSRNAFSRAFWSIMPVVLGPISRKSPEWVIEGYATYVEGRVTGSGRPHGVWGPALIRQLALEGRLPTYPELDASGAFEGGAYRYLIGSAFLDWLTRRPRMGDSSLVHLWRRLSARQNRSFDDAFIGVFGEAPAVLYGRFVADASAKAAIVASELAPSATDSGEIVQRLALQTGAPAFSKDGRFVAVPIAVPGKPSHVVVWNSAAEPDTDRAKRDSALLRRDPEDVPPIRIYPPPKKVKATLPAVAGLAFDDPRFLPDGRILTWRRTAVGDGSLGTDLYIWNWAHGDVERVTDTHDVEQGDPSRDGRSAAAIRCRGGHCDVVWVNVISGVVAPIALGGVDTSYYHPRISPDGGRILVSVNGGGTWRLVTMDTLGHDVRSVDPSDGVNRYDAEWVDPDHVVEISERGGIPQVTELDLATAAERTLTRVTGAAIAPAPSPRDSSVWFLSLYAAGYDLRRVRRNEPARPMIVAFSDTLRPVVQVPPAPSREPVHASLTESKPYGGPDTRLFRWIPAAQGSPDGAAGALALIVADVVGKTELLAKVSFGDSSAWHGGALDVTYRGLRPTVGVQLFSIEHRPAPNAASGALAIDESRFTGVEPWIEFTNARELEQESVRLGGADGSVSSDAAGPGGDMSRIMGFFHAAVAHEEQGLNWTLSQSLTLDAAATGMNQPGIPDVARRHVQTTRLAGSAQLGETGLLPLPLTATIGAGEMSWTGAPALAQYDGFTVGGLSPSLVDDAVFSQQLRVPALPTAADTGHRFWSYRVASNLFGVTPYLYGVEMTHDPMCVQLLGFVGAGGCPPTSTWQRVVGAEWSIAVPHIAIAGTPAARALLGVGRSIDPPLAKRVRAYASLEFDP